MQRPGRRVKPTQTRRTTTTTRARRQATSSSKQFSTISAKRLTDILGDQAEKLLVSATPMPSINFSQPTDDRIRQGRRGRRKKLEQNPKLVAEERDEMARTKFTRDQDHGVLASGEDSPRVISRESKTEHSSYPHLAPILEKEPAIFFEKPEDVGPASPSLLCPDVDHHRSVSPEAGRQALTGIAGGPRLTNKENISSSPAEAEVTFLGQGFADREKKDHLAKQAAFRADLDEQVRLKKERIEAEKRNRLERENREQLRERHGEKPGDSRCQSVMDTDVHSHQRVQNRLRAGRSRVFADRSDEIVECTPEEKRQQEKETLRKQIVEVRRKKEEERKREEELQRLDDERVERERRILEERWLQEQRKETSSNRHSPAGLRTPTSRMPTSESHSPARRSSSVRSFRSSSTVRATSEAMEGPKPPQPPGNNASVEYDELSRWCQQLMAEQQKMREDLKVHQLQTKERAEGEPKKKGHRRLEEEVDFLRQQVDSLRLSKAQAHGKSARQLPSPLERGYAPSSSPSPSADPPLSLPLVESPRSLVAPTRRKMGWASRSKAGFPIPTDIEGSVDFSQSCDLQQFAEQPLPGLSLSRPILAEAGLEEIGAASTFVFPEDDISLFNGTAASALSTATKETSSFPSTRKLTPPNPKTGSRRRARPKVLDPFARRQL